MKGKSSKRPSSRAQADKLNLIGCHDNKFQFPPSSRPRADVIDEVNNVDELMTTTDALLEDQKSRLAALVASSPEAIISLSTAGRIVTWNPAAIELFGYTEAEIYGAPFSILMPETETAHGRSLFERVMAGEVIREEEAFRRRKDGTLVEISGTATRIVAADGQVLGVSIIFRDLTERRATEAKAARERYLLEAVLQTAPVLIYLKDRAGRIQMANQAVLDLFGCTWEEMQGRTIGEIMNDKGEAASIDDIDRRVLEHGVADEAEQLVRRDEIGPRVWLTRKTPLRDEAGQVIGILGTSTEITARKRAEEDRKLLLQELNHRVKNLFAVVLSMIGQTAQTARTVEAMTGALTGRIGALTKAHDLLRPALVGDHLVIDSVNLNHLFAIVIEPHLSAGPQQLTIEGEAPHLGPSTATSFSLFVHELATNSAKYGALSSPAGRLRLTSVQKDDHLCLTWAESGGPEIQEAPPARGFGHRLADVSVRGQLGGSIDYHWEPEGLRIEICVPLERLGT